MRAGALAPLSEVGCCRLRKAVLGTRWTQSLRASSQQVMQHICGIAAQLVMVLSLRPYRCQSAEHACSSGQDHRLLLTDGLVSSALQQS